MPNFSAVTTATTFTADTEAPDVMKFVQNPTLQPDGNFLTILKCPTNDAKNDGTAPLTGLAASFLVHINLVNGVDPTENMSAPEILGFPGSTIQSFDSTTGVAPGAELSIVTPNDNPGGGIIWKSFCHDGAA